MKVNEVVGKNGYHSKNEHHSKLMVEIMNITLDGKTNITLGLEGGFMATNKTNDGKKHGNPHPVHARADSPGLMQNMHKEVEKHPEAIAKALKNAMMFAGDFVFDKNDPTVVSSITRVKTAEECAERLNWFFKTCADTQQLPTIEKMYLALGITRSGHGMWQYRGTNEEIRQLINQGKTIIAAMDSELATTGTLQPVVWIFRAKNFYGMRDQVDIQATTGNALEENRRLLEDKYSNVEAIDVEAKEVEKK